MERILAGAGYETFIFASAQAALAVFEQGEQVVDMLLTDVMPPGPIHGTWAIGFEPRPHAGVLCLLGRHQAEGNVGG